MSWPVDEDGAPITFIRQVDGLVLEGLVHVNGGIPQTFYGTFLTEENHGSVWARGWNTKEANALRVACAL